ncbi:MAG: DUF3263 domain-containing protein [Propionibacteriaceae bacterium]|nr:DUF3263 domain-containing protein [Propionibacteriaceae bacterium]
MAAVNQAETSGLTEVEEQMLDFEKSWFTSPEPKEQGIVQRFGCSSARYYQQLNALIDRPEALEYSPLLVKRLRRLRSQRQVARSAKRLHG